MEVSDCASKFPVAIIACKLFYTVYVYYVTGDVTFCLEIVLNTENVVIFIIYVYGSGAMCINSYIYIAIFVLMYVHILPPR